MYCTLFAVPQSIVLLAAKSDVGHILEKLTGRGLRFLYVTDRLTRYPVFYLLTYFLSS